MLKKGLKENLKVLKSEFFFWFFGIFWPNISDLIQSFLQYIAARNCKDMKDRWFQLIKRYMRERNRSFRQKKRNLWIVWETNITIESWNILRSRASSNISQNIQRRSMLVESEFMVAESWWNTCDIVVIVSGWKFVIPLQHWVEPWLLLSWACGCCFPVIPLWFVINPWIFIIK
jgi:hypothetical protein